MIELFAYAGQRQWSLGIAQVAAHRLAILKNDWLLMQLVEEVDCITPRH